MKNFLILPIACIFITGLMLVTAQAQTSAVPLVSMEKPTPWSAAQLLEPADLAVIIAKPGAVIPAIFNIGAVEDIKGAKHIGAVNNAENLEKFKNETRSLPRNTEVVIYCGCCPFTKCPNIRPAFTELTKMGFTNIKVLNLSTNLKTNWIAKGYPLAEGN